MKTNLLLAFMGASLCAFGADKANDVRAAALARLGDLGKASIKTAPRAVTSNATAAGSSVRSVVAVNQTIYPGYVFDSGELAIDFSGAENVAIAISSSSDLTSTVIGVEWAAPGDYFVLTDMVLGSDLVAPNAPGMGGGRVPVYGPALKIVVLNAGTTPVTIRQLSVYACFR